MRLLPCLLGFLSVALVSQAIQSSAQEWPRFRGKDGSGIGKLSSLPAVISEADYSWVIKLDGVGHSSPILWGDKLFLTIAKEDNSSRSVLCIDSLSAKQLWKWDHTFEEHNLNNHNNFASSTPTADENGVYVVWGSGTATRVIALSHEGKELWSREWPDFTSDHGFGSSPIIVDGTLIFHTDAKDKRRSFVMGLNPKTGETVWQLERVTPDEDPKHLTAYNTPTSVTIGGKEMLVVLQTNDGWKGIDPKTGDVLWGFDGEYKLRSVGSIAASNDIVFATLGSGSRGQDATALRIRENGDPEVLYSLDKTARLSYVPTPIIYEGKLFLLRDADDLSCLDLKTGKVLNHVEVAANFFSSPVIANGKLLFASKEGQLFAYSADEKLEQLGVSHLPSGMNGTPAIANNRLFLRTDTHLICIEGK